MKKFRCIFAPLALAFLCSNASAIEYSQVLAEKSTLTFTSQQMGVPVQGRFPKFLARVAFDPAKPEAAKVDITVDLNAIDAGSQEANDEVVGKQWFNVRMFPSASFVSTKIKALSASRYEVSGPLTIKGRAVPITATFTLKTEGAAAVFDGGFTMKRIDFAIGEGPWADGSTVANDIQVTFRIVAAPVKAATNNSK